MLPMSAPLGGFLGPPSNFALACFPVIKLVLFLCFAAVIARFVGSEVDGSYQGVLDLFTVLCGLFMFRSFDYLQTCLCTFCLVALMSAVVDAMSLGVNIHTLGTHSFSDLCSIELSKNASYTCSWRTPVGTGALIAATVAQAAAAVLGFMVHRSMKIDNPMNLSDGLGVGPDFEEGNYLRRQGRHFGGGVLGSSNMAAGMANIPNDEARRPLAGNGHGAPAGQPGFVAFGGQGNRLD